MASLTSRFVDMNKLELKIGDKAVYPAHGVAQVIAIETREVAGQHKDFYILRIVGSGFKLTVPTDGAKRAGLRGLMSKQAVRRLLTLLRQPVDIPVGLPWAKRAREYNEMIGSGELANVARIVRELHQRAHERELSYSERKVLEHARALIVSEIAVARECSEERACQQIDTALAANL